MTVEETKAREELGVVPESGEVFGARAEAFDSLVAERRGMKELIAMTEAEVKALDKKLMAFFADNEHKKVMSGNVPVQVCTNPGRSHMDEMKLIEKGVPALLIKECTVQGTPYSYILVGKEKTR